MSHSIRELLGVTNGSLILGRPDTFFKRISIDTRTLMPADAFFALHGPHFDGHDFLRFAGDRGASVLVIDTLDDQLQSSEERPADVVLVDDTLRALQRFAASVRAQSLARIVGITGSNGKTTTKEMLASILKLSGKTLATRGNLNNHIGLPLTCCGLESDHRFAVIEMGTSKKGDMEVLVEVLKPDVALITNVGKDHLEFLGTPEGVLEENQVLFDQMPEKGIAVMNLDDPLLSALSARWSRQQITYGIEKDDADVAAYGIKAWPLPIRFELRIGEQRLEAILNAPGSFQVKNALAAAATAHALGISPQQIVEGFRQFTPVAMRMQAHAGPGDSVLMNDAYNANPSSVRASVESFCESYLDRPRWLVLGDMRELGAIARQEHRDLGAWLAGQKLDRIFLYGRDTRFVLEGLRTSSAMPATKRFKKKEILIEELQIALAKEKPAVLFKASRSLKLEDVLTPLIVNSSSTEATVH
jgi:UDP-N-acetylmuramoyl-tripeptide--D-alanyl-D-alanine ligase